LIASEGVFARDETTMREISIKKSDEREEGELGAMLLLSYARTAIPLLHK
jgi:hypothetical protein